MIHNPFPGPQPYRTSDRDRFFGRIDLSYRLENSIGANRCVTLYGPSGAGKSSLLQASVLPRLVESNEVRVVRVDGWPEGQDPVQWLAAALYTDLRQGNPPIGQSPCELVHSSVKRAARSSSRMLLIVLDQIEQLLYKERDSKATDNFFGCLDDVLSLHLGTLRIVLSLREDYLGRFRERLRDRDRLLKHGFRVGPLTVSELTESVCRAADTGTPPQTWSAKEMYALMLQVRVPGGAATGDAEAQTAYAQIVCRALFQLRARGDAVDGSAVEAEPILHEYLDTSLDTLGPLRGAAERLLEEHLVTADGGRTLRTEEELHRHFTPEELVKILGVLENAAILHAEEHQGGRYFEIGHDWLARKAFERRKARADELAWRLQEEALAREIAKAREQHANLKEMWWLHDQQRRALAKVRSQRRVLLVFIGISLMLAIASVTLVFVYA